MDETLYKVLAADGSAIHGTGSWHLPEGNRPGEWMAPIEGNLIAYKNGYHLCRRGDLVKCVGPRIFVAECRGEMVEAAGKIVVREARLVRELAWNETKARLFAADCAERALKIYEAIYPDDARPRQAVEAARKFARGKITPEEMAAAWAAAWAAEAAAWDAAWDAACAARSAARAAAREAAGAALAAERGWQTNRLFAYLNDEVLAGVTRIAALVKADGIPR